MPNTVLVDGSNIAHANDKGAKLTVGTKNTQAIYGMLRSMRVLLTEHRDWNLLTLWDGRAQWRYDIHPEYKGNRAPKTPEEAAEKEMYQWQVGVIRKMFQILGLTQLLVKTQEADDLAGYLSGLLTRAGNRVKLVSGDMDWIQLVNEMCQWFDPIRDRRITHSDFFEKTGFFTPRAFLEGKALIGDTSDNIDGVAGIGKKKAPEILAQFDSVAEFWRRVEAGEFTPKYVIHKNLASPEGRERFARNVQLMNLIDAKPIVAAETVRLQPAFNAEQFRVLCTKLHFHSVLRDFDNFIAPFQENATLYKKAA